MKLLYNKWIYSIFFTILFLCLSSSFAYSITNKIFKNTLYKKCPTIFGIIIHSIILLFLVRFSINRNIYEGIILSNTESYKYLPKMRKKGKYEKKGRRWRWVKGAEYGEDGHSHILFINDKNPATIVSLRGSNNKIHKHAILVRIRGNLYGPGQPSGRNRKWFTEEINGNNSNHEHSISSDIIEEIIKEIKNNPLDKYNERYMIDIINKNINNNPNSDSVLKNRINNIENTIENILDIKDTFVGQIIPFEGFENKTDLLTNLSNNTNKKLDKNVFYSDISNINISLNNNSNRLKNINIPDIDDKKIQELLIQKIKEQDISGQITNLMNNSQQWNDYLSKNLNDEEIFNNLLQEYDFKNEHQLNNIDPKFDKMNNDINTISTINNYNNDTIQALYTNENKFHVHGDTTRLDKLKNDLKEQYSSS